MARAIGYDFAAASVALAGFARAQFPAEYNEYLIAVKEKHILLYNDYVILCL